jgi:multiple sugar transport system substrate-binding protein
MRHKALAAVLAAISLALAAACSSSAEKTPAGSSTEKPGGTVVVWDYYGSSTPLKPALAAFATAHPEIKVKYEAFDYETMQDKFSVSVSSGAAPDLATLDMTWIPTYAAQGILADVSKLSGGKLNGAPIADSYSPGALHAMTFDGHLITALYDFDAYALYYRKDIFAKKGIAVPKTWEEMLAATKAIAEDTNGDGKPDHYALQVLPDTFHYAQLLFQAGGALLDKDNKHAVFNSAAGIKALDYLKQLLDGGGGLYWGDSQGDSTGLPGIKDNRIGMFLNGPYMMGVLRDGDASQSGKWAVAPAPIDKQPGSYLGGTGLTIPVNAKNPRAAWVLAQFLLRPEQQALVYTSAGAAPATKQGVTQPALSKPDPFLGGQVAFPVFSQALATATPYPYVASWPDIDKAITDAVTAVLLGKSTSKQALDKAAKTVDSALSG